jgi:hypothetical protein
MARRTLADIYRALQPPGLAPRHASIDFLTGLRYILLMQRGIASFALLITLGLTCPWARD